MKWDTAEVEKWLHLVEGPAKSMSRRTPPCVEYEDLYQCGVFGLADAIRLYRPEHGVPFEKYADTRIRGAILDGLRVMDWVPILERRRGNKTTAMTSLDAVRDRHRDCYTGRECEFIGSVDRSYSDADDRDEVEWLLRGIHGKDREIVILYSLQEKSMDSAVQAVGVNKSRGFQIHSRAIGLLMERAAA